MPAKVKHRRSPDPDKRPDPSKLLDGQIAINTAAQTPGMFFKNSEGELVKVGPAHVGNSAPNAAPSGSSGNSKGELWVDESISPKGLNYYDGSSFNNLTPSGTTEAAGLVELATNAETQAGVDTARAVTPSALQSKVSDSTSTDSSTTIASSAAVKAAYDLAALGSGIGSSGGTITGTLAIGSTGSFVFEGATDDDFETTLDVVDPTADRTILLPNTDGTVVTTGDTGTVTSAMIANGTIVDADISGSAGITDGKLATISTAGKVANSATTATNLNTANAIVSRDASNNFVAGTITAELSGNAATATKLQTARSIALTGDVSGSANFDGSGNISISAVVADNSHNHDATNITSGTLDVARLLAPVSGNWWRGVGLIGSDGVMEVGRYIDFHSTNTTTADYDARLEVTGTGALSLSGQRIFAENYHPNADKWTSGITITFGTDLSGSVTFDGSANVTANISVEDDSHAHAFNNLTDKTSGTGDYETTGQFIAGTLRSDTLTNKNGQQLILNAGESAGKITGQNEERVYINAESGLRVNSSSNNWTTPYVVYTATICSSNLGISTFPGPVFAGDVEIFSSIVSFNEISNTKYDTAAEIPAGDTHILVGADNGTNLTIPANLNLYSYWGVGFGPTITGQSVAKGELSHIFNVRNGDAQFRGDLSLGGDILPDTNNTGVVGNTSFTWNNGQFTSLTINEILNVREALDLADNDILRLGSSDDWEFFHNGTHNYMDLNVGDLYIRDNTTTRFTFERTTGTLLASTFNATSTTNGGFQGIDSDSATNPSFTWSADLDTGMYRSGTDQIGFTCGGSLITFITTSYMYHRQAMYISNDADSAASSTTTLRDSEALYFRGKYWNGSSSANGEWRIWNDMQSTAPASNLLFQWQGGTKAYIQESGTIVASTFNATSTANGGFQGIDADSATNPSFTWSADLNTGMYRSDTDQIGFTCAGTQRLRVETTGATVTGRIVVGDGASTFTHSSQVPVVINRKVNDGQLIQFQQDGTVEGNISVSGTTVSYNGAHLSRWSQIPDIDPHDRSQRPEILRGTVMSNLDEMCEWIDPESGERQNNEQLNKTKISDIEGDRNVAGIFQGWDDDDDTWTSDFYLAMTGDFIIRIAQGVTVERGDLLMSAGDGTARPQDDDIIRSKTIAKVTSTNVSCTYVDGSYCVPCVLMAC